MRMKIKMVYIVWLLCAFLLLAIAYVMYSAPEKVQPLPAQPTPAPAKPSVENHKVAELSSSEDGDSFLKSGPGILMAYAPWCGHCKNMMNAYEMASTQSPVKFARLEGQKAADFMRKHEIRGFPTLLVVNKNNEVSRYSGGRDLASLLAGVGAL